MKEISFMYDLKDWLKKSLAKIVNLRNRKSDKKNKIEEESICIDKEDLLNSLGVEIMDRRKDGVFVVGFQGGYFVFKFDGSYLYILFTDFLECTYGEAAKATFVANLINREYMGWTCYLRTAEDGKNRKPVSVCLSQLFNMTGTVQQLAEYIRKALLLSFTISRDYRERFNKALEETGSLDDYLNDHDFQNKLKLLTRLREIEEQDSESEKVLTSDLTLNALKNLFDDSDFGTIQKMKIIDDDKIELITDITEINKFDIRQYVRNHPQNKSLNDLLFIVYYEKQNLIVSMKKQEGSTEKSLFFLMNLIRSGINSDTSDDDLTPLGCRTAVEIRLTNEKEDYWEVKYMLDDAKEKQEAGKVAELSDEQKMLLTSMKPGVKSDVYWGKKYFNKGNYIQSLFYFKRIFNRITDSNVSEIYNDDSFLREISFYIGLIYFELKLYDRSFYYFHKAKKESSIMVLEGYINCLCKMSDADAIDYIKDLIDSITVQLNTEGQKEAILLDFYKFLHRRLVNINVLTMRLDDAERLLNKMLLNGEDRDYIQREMAYIHQLKKVLKDK